MKEQGESSWTLNHVDIETDIPIEGKSTGLSFSILIISDVLMTFHFMQFINSYRKAKLN